MGYKNIKTSRKNKNLRKKIGLVALAIILILISIFINMWMSEGSLSFNQKYGINPYVISTVIVFSEIAFDFGILMMLFGSGMYKITLKDITRFDFDKVHFSGKIVYLGFLINRLAASVPSSYVLITSFAKIPIAIDLLLVLEIISTVLIGFLVKIDYNKEKANN